MSSQRGGRPVTKRRCLLKQRSTAAVRSAKASFTKLAPACITRRAKSVAPCVEPARQQAHRRASLLVNAVSPAVVRCANASSTRLAPARITRQAKNVAPCVEPTQRQASRRVPLLAKAVEHCRRTQRLSQLRQAGTCSLYAPSEERSAVCRARSAAGRLCASLLVKAAEHCRRTQCQGQLQKAGTCSHHAPSEERIAVCRASAAAGPSPRVAACQSAYAS